MAAIYLFSESLTTQQICAMHRLGPGYKVSKILRSKGGRTFAIVTSSSFFTATKRKKLNSPKWISWKQHYGNVKTKEVVSVTINVFVNRAKTHPNGCSFFSCSWSCTKRVNTTFHEQQEKGQKANVWERGKWVESSLEWNIRRKLWDVIYLLKAPKKSSCYR